MEHGIITSVYYDEGVVTCDVQPIRGSDQYDRVPVLKPFGGMYRTPKPRMTVAMDKLDDGTRFIQGFITRDSSDTYPAEMEPEEFVIRVDDGTAIELTKNDDGTYNLDLSASGDVTINGTAQ